jgi:hypothetical protein
MFSWDLEFGWTKEYGFLGVGKNGYNLGQNQ